MGEVKEQYDPYITGNCQPTDLNSPIAYVHSFLNRRLRVFLADGCRQIIGIFVALDYTAMITLHNAVEIVEDHERPLEFVLIPLGQVQSMEALD
jgi:small nuclear ribonucleoprotein (snRNP)-like protein